MKGVLFFGLSAVLIMLLQTNILGLVIPTGYKPDLFLVFVFWTGLRIPSLAGVILTCAGGLGVDLLSGAVTGLFGVLYALVFVLGGYLNTVFQVDTPAVRTATLLCASLGAGAAVILTRTLAGPAAPEWITFWWLGAKSVVTAVAGLLIFPLLDRFWTVYSATMGTR